MGGRVAIIGAGPAGSAAAIVLARGGREVTLIEQHRFPRDKVCGECLSAEGIAVLRRLGLFDALTELGMVKFSHSAIHWMDGESVRLVLPRPMWGISRFTFDSFLLDAARTAGAKVLQPARCEAVRVGDRHCVQLRMLEPNERLVLEVDHVIVADGKGALLKRRGATGDFGIKAHFEGIGGPRDTIELFGCNGLYGGLAAIEGGRWNAAFSVPAARLRRHRGNLAAVFSEIVGESPVLRGRMSHCVQVCKWIAAPLPRFGVRDDWPSGIIPAGNAAAALEPIGGEGMGLALLSGARAAESLMSKRSMALADEYRRLWRLRRVSCRAAGLLISRPRLSPFIGPVLQSSPLVGRIGLQLLGK